MYLLSHSYCLVMLCPCLRRHAALLYLNCPFGMNKVWFWYSIGIHPHCLNSLVSFCLVENQLCFRALQRNPGKVSWDVLLSCCYCHVCTVKVLTTDICQKWDVDFSGHWLVKDISNTCQQLCCQHDKSNLTKAFGDTEVEIIEELFNEFLWML